MLEVCDRPCVLGVQAAEQLLLGSRLNWLGGKRGGRDGPASQRRWPPQDGSNNDITVLLVLADDHDFGHAADDIRYLQILLVYTLAYCLACCIPWDLIMCFHLREPVTAAVERSARDLCNSTQMIADAYDC